MSKFTLSRKANEVLKFSDAQVQAKLAEAYEQTRDLRGRRRVHPEITRLAADAWSEMTSRLQFETSRPYDQCSREIARRHPWVYLAQDSGSDHTFDVDLEEVRA